MVYCGSGTETYEEQQTDACCDKILWSTAEAVLRLLRIANDIKNLDPMVYCGSGTETY